MVYLECDADTVAERIARNSGRPLLAGDAMDRWKTLFATRRPVYERLADVVLDVRSGEFRTSRTGSKMRCAGTPPRDRGRDRASGDKGS